MNGSFSAKIGANISKFMANMKRVQQQIHTSAKDVNITVDANTRPFDRAIARIKMKTAQLEADHVKITIEARIQKFQATISRIATNIRAFGELVEHTMMGLKTTLLPAIAPLISNIGVAIANLGPVIGVVFGQTLGLVGAFGTASIAAVAFGAVAIPIIARLFDGEAKLNAEQAKAKKSFDDLASTFRNIQTLVEQSVLEAFTNAVQTLNIVLYQLRPLINSTADAFNTLMSQLRQSIGTPEIQGFLEYLNKTGAEFFSIFGRSVGYLFKGLASLLTNIAPLSMFAAQGFENMSKSFAKFTAGLSESKKFESFVAYTIENLPKVKRIFVDMTAGLIYFFAAFGASSSGFLDGLAEMMARFKRFSSTLSENQGFQTFLAYVSQTAPQVIALIGNLTKFLVNLGIGMAPVGYALLKGANSALVFLNALLENNRAIGVILALLISFSGVLLAVVPNVIALSSLFTGLGSALAIGVGKSILFVTGLFTNFGATIVPVTAAITKFGHAAKLAWLSLTGPIGLVVIAVAAFIAILVVMYKKNEEFREKVDIAWNAIKEVISSVTTAITKLVVEMWSKITSFWEKNQGNILKNVKNVWRSIQIIVNVAMDAILLIFKIFWPIISRIAKSAWDIIGLYVNNGITLVLGAIKLFSDVLNGDWSAAWETVKSTTKTILSNIADFLTNSSLAEFSKNLGTEISEGFTTSLSAISTWFSEQNTKIREDLNNWGNTISNWLDEKNNTWNEKLNTWSVTIERWFNEMPGKIANKLSEWGAAISNWTTAQNEENKRQFGEWGNTILNWFDEMPSKISNKISEWGTVISDWFSTTKETISNKISEWGNVISDWFASMPSVISNKISSWSNTITNWFSTTRETISDKISEWGDTLSNWFNEMPSNIGSWLSNWWNKLSEWFSSVPAMISEKLDEWWSSLKTWFDDLPNKKEVKNAGKNLVDKMAEGTEEEKQDFTSRLGQIIVDVAIGAVLFAGVALLAAGREIIKRLLEGINEEVPKLLEAMSDLGADVAKGIAKGITSGIDYVKKSVSGLASNIVGWFKKDMDIHSPSRVMADLAQWVPKGVAVGINDNLGPVKKASQAMAKAVHPDFSQTVKATDNLMNQAKRVASKSAKETQMEIKKIEEEYAQKRQELVKKSSDNIAETNAKARDKEQSLNASQQRAITNNQVKTNDQLIKLEKEKANKIAEVNGKSEKNRYDALKQYLDRNVQLEKFTTQEVASYWEYVTRTFKEGTDERIESQIQFNKAISDLTKEQFEKEKSYVESMKRYKTLSLTQELKVYENYISKHKKGSEEQIYYQEKIEDTRVAIHERLLALNDEFANKIKQSQQAEIDGIASINDKYQQAEDARYNSYQTALGLFDEIQEKEDVVGDTLINNLQDQVAQMRDWANSLQSLANKGINQGLLAELQSAGPSAAKELSALNNLTEKQLSEYDDLWLQKSAVAREQAKIELIGLREDSDKEIEELKKTTSTQLDQYKDEWIKQVKAIRNGTVDEFNPMVSSLSQIGMEAMRGLAKGMRDQTEEVRKAAKEVSDVIDKTIRKNLQIKSPSRVTAKDGMYAGRGLVEGLNSTKSEVAKATRGLTDMMQNDLSAASLGLETSLSGGVNSKLVNSYEMTSGNDQVGLLKQIAGLIGKLNLTVELDGDIISEKVDKNRGRNFSALQSLSGV